MDEKRAGHSPAENAAHSHLGSSHSRRDRSKEKLEVSSVVSLLRVSSRGLKESSMSMTWTSVCIPRSSKVSKGLRVFTFFVAGALSSSNSVGAGDDSLDVL